MTRVMLDTSAYSAFMRGHRKVAQAVKEADEICLSPVVLGELRAGFLKGSQLERNLEGLERFVSSPRVVLHAITAETAERYSLILNGLRKSGTPLPANDVWIAAGAMEHALRVLTTDAHYRKIPQVIVDYFDVTSLDSETAF